MAATLAPSASFTYAKEMIKKMPLERVQAEILQDASSLIWAAATWRWSIGTGGPINITAAQAQSATFSIPSDFLRLEKCAVSNGTSWRELTPVGQAPLTPSISQWPNYAAVTGAASTTGPVFFDAKFPESSWQLWYWYKKAAPSITLANMNGAGVLVMDDDWFWVYNEAVLYYAYKFGDDPRAGTSEVQASANGPTVKYSGQIGAVKAAIEQMRQSENLLMGFPQLIPDPIKDR